VAHLAAIEDYNSSDIAINGGYVYKYSNEKLNELVYLLSGLSIGSKVIDIGVGMGVATRTIAKLGFYSIAIDNPKTGRAGEDLKLLENTVMETLSLDICSDKLPFPDNSIDAVLFSDVIEHLIDSPRNILSEINRVLRPGGICVATTPNALRATVRLKVFLGFSNWPSITDFYYSDVHGGHHHEYTKDEFIFAFKELNYVIEKFLAYGTMKDVIIGSFSELHSRSRAGPLQSKKGNVFFKIGAYIVSFFERIHNLAPQFLIVAKKKS